MKPRAGMGVDRLAPCDIERLPDAGVAELCALFAAIEYLLVWPVQTMLVLGRLLPQKLNGDRVIGLVTVLSRVWGMSREPWVKSWSRSTEAHWDAAVI
eukprot:9465050-Pyramimonas_sp.AAC.1